MNKINFFSLAAFLLISSTFLGYSQERQRQTIRTSSSEINIGALVDDDLQLLYPEKTKGEVHYSNGEFEVYDMNYNILLDEIHYLTRRGRSHSLQANPPFDKVLINDKVLIYDEQLGFLEQLHSGKNNLYLKHEVNISTLPVRRGAYGTTDHTSSIDVATIQQPGAQNHVSEVRLSNPEAQELEITIRYNDYFVFEKNGELNRINNRRQLLRMFSDHSSDIRTFIRQNDIDFDNKGDMVKLAKYIETLN